MHEIFLAVLPMSARKFKMAVSMSAEQVVEQMFDESEGEDNSGKG
jgi:hypothetical protein